jgi:hypothetical protein
MIGLLTRKKVRPTPRFARPSLEALEGRDAPSTLAITLEYGGGKCGNISGTLGDTANPGGQTIVFSGITTGTCTTSSDGTFVFPCVFTSLGTVSARGPGSNVATATLNIAPPHLNSFDAYEQPMGFSLQGSVSYSSIFSDVTIRFGGAPQSLQNATCMVDYTGNYNYVALLNGTSSDNGTATAQAVDVWGQTSNIVCDYIHQTGT